MVINRRLSNESSTDLYPSPLSNRGFVGRRNHVLRKARPESFHGSYQDQARPLLSVHIRMLHTQKVRKYKVVIRGPSRLDCRHCKRLLLQKIFSTKSRC